MNINIFGGYVNPIPMREGGGGYAHHIPLSIGASAVYQLNNIIKQKIYGTAADSDQK
jgi:hypothetical protein